jgi:hypothetical protein
MDMFEFNAAAEAPLPQGIASVLYFVHFALVITFALLLALVLVPTAIIWSIFLDLPMWLRVIFIYLIARRMLAVRGP